MLLLALGVFFEAWRPSGMWNHLGPTFSAFGNQVGQIGHPWETGRLDVHPEGSPCGLFGLPKRSHLASCKSHGGLVEPRHVSGSNKTAKLLAVPQASYILGSLWGAGGKKVIQGMATVWLASASRAEKLRHLEATWQEALRQLARSLRL